MRCLYLIISTIFFSNVIHAQEAKRPVIPVAPIIDRPLTTDEVRDRKAKVDAPDITQAYEQSFAPLEMPSSVPSSFLERVAKAWEPKQKYAVQPMDNIMVPVGQGLMNTISTNLKMINAKSNDETSPIEATEGYLYVTVNTLNPISIVLWEEGALESQVSITLVPVAAPPTLVQIEFDLSEEMIAKSKAFRDAEDLRMKIESQDVTSAANTPYQQMVANLLLPVARGDIPKGFGLTPAVPSQYRYPCAMTIFHEAQQRLVSGKYIIDVVHVVNDSDQTYNVREEMCLAKFVTAVALYQKAYLQPGEESEIYILRDKMASEKEKQRQRRPSLIGG